MIFLVDVFIEKLIFIYNIIILLSIIIYPFIIKKKGKIIDIEESTEYREKWKSVFNVIMIGLLLIIIVVLIFFIFKKSLLWVLIPITVITVLEKLNEAYASLSVMRETLRIKGNQDLSKRESDSIIILASALMMLNIYKVPQKIVEETCNLQNAILSDWVTIIITVLIVTLYVFLIGILGLIPIKAIILLLRKIKRKIKREKIRLIEKKYNAIRTKLVKGNFLSVIFVDWTLHKNPKARIWWMALMILIPLDLVLKLIGGIIFILLSIIVYVYYILLRVNKSLALFFDWFNTISERKVLNMIFRGAFIISVATIVMINRYTPLLRVYDATTGVLEFLASAIIIPLILSWIMEYKTSVRNKEELETH